MFIHTSPEAKPLDSQSNKYLFKYKHCINKEILAVIKPLKDGLDVFL